MACNFDWMLVAAALMLSPTGTLAAEAAPASPSRLARARAEANELKWVLFPGIYKAYDDSSSGFEASLLYKGVGGVLGIEDGKFRYGEVEIALWFVSLGVGPRRNDAGGNDWQATWALPVLPVFPYGRWFATKDERKAEYGFMIKIPLWDFWNAD